MTGSAAGLIARTAARPSSAGRLGAAFALALRRPFTVSVPGRGPRAAEDQEKYDPLPPFTPLPASERRVSMTGVPPEQLGMQSDPRWTRPGAELLYSLDKEHRARHDRDGRSALFDVASPDCLDCGSILLIHQVASRANPRPQVFAGVLTKVSRRGMGTNFTVRNYVLGTGVDLKLMLYAPSLTSIRVLRRARTGHKDTLPETAIGNAKSFAEIEQLIISARLAEEREARENVRFNIKKRAQ